MDCWVIISLKSKPSQLEPCGIIFNFVLFLLLDFKINQVIFLNGENLHQDSVQCIILICVNLIVFSLNFHALNVPKQARNDYEWTSQIMSWYCIVIISSIVTEVRCSQYAVILPSEQKCPYSTERWKYWTSKSSYKKIGFAL